ncbi:MAG: hypothetical protein Kow0022_12570 [Phycisphaerales bacterium]
MTDITTRKPDCQLVAVKEPRRWALAAVGVACVGMGAIGVFVPGLPTTIFLIIASWCFTRSCPWLEERVRRLRIFKPFYQVIDNGGRMPRRAKVISWTFMWTAIAISTALLISQGLHPAVWGSVIAAGIVGTLAILAL